MDELNEFNQMIQMIEGASFSCNIYAELSIESLMSEYKKNLSELVDNKFSLKEPLLYKNPLASQQDYREYTKYRMILKNK